MAPHRFSTPPFDRPRPVLATEESYLRMDKQIARRQAQYQRRLDWHEFDCPRSPKPEGKGGAK